MTEQVATRGIEPVVSDPRVDALSVSYGKDLKQAFVSEVPSTI